MSKTAGEYRIHAAVFGERAQFPARWTSEGGVDDGRAGRFEGVRVYLAHGAKDETVRPDQAVLMAGFLARNHRGFTFDVDRAGAHDWAFWNSKLPAAFAVLQSTLED